ncbi:MAG: chorismate mutase [Holophagales bacterium]|jgi:chorismate mutase/prephenate dehydratase|nr:chorismate mutase [Holophagales bacterium]
MDTSPDGAIKALRCEIDGIDDQLLALLNRRAASASQIGILKAAIYAECQDGSQCLRDPAREGAIIARLEKANEGPFPSNAIAPIFNQIFTACLSLQNTRQQI